MAGKLRLLSMVLPCYNLFRRFSRPNFLRPSFLRSGVLYTFIGITSAGLTGFGGTAHVAYADILGRGEGDHQFLSFNTVAWDKTQDEAGKVKQNGFLPGIDYTYRWGIENGGAQAIVQGQVIWNIQANALLPLPPVPGGRARLSELSEESWSKLALYDVKLKLILREKEAPDQGYGPDQRYGVVLDLGIPNKPGEKSWSITVPKQVSWDKLLTHYQGPGLNNGTYLTSDEARAVVGPAGEEKELVVESSWLVSARMSTVSYFDDLLQRRVDWQAELMVRTIETQLNSLERITGLPIEKIRQDLAVTRVDINRNITAVPSGVVHLYQKMNKGVPDRYISPVRRHYYHAERERIQGEALRELELLKPGQVVDDYPTWFDSKVREMGEP